MNNLMTTNKVADFCGVSVSTVLRWNSVKVGELAEKYRPDFPDPTSNPAQINGHHVRFTNLPELLRNVKQLRYEMTHPIAHSQT